MNTPRVEPARLRVPWSEEAEVSVLSAMLIDGDAGRRAAELLDDEAFYKESNRRIFKAIVALGTFGRAVDPVTLADALKDIDQLEAVGGMSYIASLVDAVPSSANIDNHIRILREKHQRRQLIEAATDLIRHAESGDVDAATARIGELARTNGHAATNGTTSYHGLIVTPFLDVKETVVDEVWQGRLVRGVLNWIAGKGDVGKSSVKDDLVARWSRGLPLPGETVGREPLNTLMYLTEDPPSRVRQRLRLAGADLSRVHLLEGKPDPYDPESAIDVDLADVPRIRGAIQDHRISNVIFDALKDFTRVGNDYKESEVRPALAPLKRLAREENVVFLGILHVGKSQGRTASDSVLGSRAWVDAARIVLNVGFLEGTAGPRGLGVAKNNLAPKAPVLVFDLVDESGIPRVQWEDAPRTDLRADDLAPRAIDPEEPSTALDDAREFLRAELRHGPVESKIIRESAEAEGHKWRTVRRAKSAEGIEASKDGTGPWKWSLPEDGQEGWPPSDGHDVGHLPNDAEICGDPSDAEGKGGQGGHIYARGHLPSFEDVQEELEGMWKNP